MTVREENEVLQLLRKIDHTLHGPDGESEKGLVVRVALLEQTDGIRKWRDHAMMTGVLSAIGMAIYNFFKGIKS